jgi:peptide/nickel transport system permease protein
MTTLFSKTKPKRRERSATHKALRRFTRNPLSITGLLLVVILVVVASLAPVLSPHDPTKQNLLDRRSQPFGKYVLGKDLFGRDILSRLIYGARASIFVAFFSVLIALAGGMLIGTICGYWGGLIDGVLMRLMDLMLSFPYLLLAILFVAAVGPGIVNTTLAIGIWAMPTFARMVRAAVLGIIKKDYVMASRAVGAPAHNIILWHVIPNFVAPVVVYATLFMANAIMLEAALSFLGIGVQVPTPSWGEMISSGRNLLMVAPHVATIPGLAIMLAVLGFNLLGDGLRDALDPKMKIP